MASYASALGQQQNNKRRGHVRNGPLTQVKGKLYYDQSHKSYVVRPMGGAKVILVPEGVVAKTFRDREVYKWQGVMKGTTVRIKVMDWKNQRGLCSASEMSFCSLKEQPGASQPYIDRLLQGRKMFMQKNHAKYWGNEGEQDRATVQHVRLAVKKKNGQVRDSRSPSRGRGRTPPTSGPPSPIRSARFQGLLAPGPQRGRSHSPMLKPFKGFSKSADASPQRNGFSGQRGFRHVKPLKLPSLDDRAKSADVGPKRRFVNSRLRKRPQVTVTGADEEVGNGKLTIQVDSGDKVTPLVTPDIKGFTTFEQLFGIGKPPLSPAVSKKASPIVAKESPKTKEVPEMVSVVSSNEIVDAMSGLAVKQETQVLKAEVPEVKFTRVSQSGDMLC